MPDGKHFNYIEIILAYHFSYDDELFIIKKAVWNMIHSLGVFFSTLIILKMPVKGKLEGYKLAFS